MGIMDKITPDSWSNADCPHCGTTLDLSDESVTDEIEC